MTVWQVSAPPSAVDLVHAYAAAALQQESSSLLEAIQLATRLQVQKQHVDCNVAAKSPRVSCKGWVDAVEKEEGR